MSPPVETRIALAVLPAGLDQAGHRQYWLERRPDSAHLGGMLAFPGGKCQPDESPQDALARELFEELGIQPQEPRLRMEIPWVYLAESNDLDGKQKSRHLRLIVYQVEKWQGRLHGREGQSVTPQTLDCSRQSEWMSALPPANRGIVAALCLPPRIAITAACGSGDAGFVVWHQALVETVNALQQRFGSSFGERSAIVQLRPGRELGITQWRAAVTTVQSMGLSAWVNADLDTAFECRADGVHLNRYRLALDAREALAGWRAENRWVSASGHTLEEVRRANEVGVDALLISPILPTSSHPGEPGIGWAQFAALTREATMPTYALGGMSDSHLSQVQNHGGQGIAAIRGFWLG
jgi:8-oxo-dGTP diphosphatase